MNLIFLSLKIFMNSFVLLNFTLFLALKHDLSFAASAAILVFGQLLVKYVQINAGGFKSI